MKYIQRIIDKEIDRRIEAFNGINIIGPKGCGKTRTAVERCETIIEFQDEDKRDGYLMIANTSPTLLLKNKKPILFDEWQDAPKIWGAIRKDCDDHSNCFGEYYLTGSTSQKVETAHTGTGRITEITMYPMTIYETGESNGAISFTKLFDDDYDFAGAMSALSLEDLFFLACRGGWPRCLSIKKKEAQLEIAKDYYRQIVNKDIHNVDGVKRNSEWVRMILWSYARNMATLAKKKNIYADIKANATITDQTITAYIRALEDLFVIKDIDAWTPQIRSKTAIRSSKKHIFIDPSIGMAALGVSPSYFEKDLDLFGHVFENMVLRDLLVYAEAHGDHLMHYRDDTGMEADAVYQRSNGDYALIEVKLGTNAIAKAEKDLLKFKKVIKEHNEKVLKDKDHPGVVYREPSKLIIICATATIAYTTDNGVLVIPYGCLKD